MNDNEYKRTLLALQQRVNLVPRQPGEELSEEFFEDRARKIAVLKSEIDDHLFDIYIDEFSDSILGDREPVCNDIAHPNA